MGGRERQQIPCVVSSDFSIILALYHVSQQLYCLLSLLQAYCSPLKDIQQPIRILLGYPHLFGLNTRFQDFRNLYKHNSSGRALSPTTMQYALGPTYVSTVVGSVNIFAVDVSNSADDKKDKWAQTAAKYMDKGLPSRFRCVCK